MRGLGRTAAPLHSCGDRNNTSYDLGTVLTGYENFTTKQGGQQWMRFLQRSFLTTADKVAKNLSVIFGVFMARRRLGFLFTPHLTKTFAILHRRRHLRISDLLFHEKEPNKWNATGIQSENSAEDWRIPTDLVKDNIGEKSSDAFTQYF